MTETSKPLEFTIHADGDFLRINLKTVFGFPEETSHWGGYNTQSELEIRSSVFSVLSQLYISTGDIYNFYEQLSNCYESLTGSANLTSYEGNLKLSVTFDNQGHAVVSGEFAEYLPPSNSLKFNMLTDQSYLKETVSELKRIYLKYGNNYGVNGL